MLILLNYILSGNMLLTSDNSYIKVHLTFYYYYQKCKTGNQDVYVHLLCQRVL